jgi:hypothetical protein
MELDWRAGGSFNFLFGGRPCQSFAVGCRAISSMSPLSRLIRLFSRMSLYHSQIVPPHRNGLSGEIDSRPEQDLVPASFVPAPVSHEPTIRVVLVDCQPSIVG